MKAPAFQLYVDDLLGGTVHFDNAEFGLYVRLLLAQFSEGSLPDDDRELLRFGKGRTPLHRIRLKFVKGSDGRLRNSRMEKTRQAQAEYRANRIQSGKLGAKNRWHSHQTANGTAIKQPMASGMAKNSPPSPTPSPTTKKTTKLPASFTEWQTELTADYDRALGSEWENDRQKWMTRIKRYTAKSARVLAEVQNAQKENRILTTPARYAEQIWNEFK